MSVYGTCLEEALYMLSGVPEAWDTGSEYIFRRDGGWQGEVSSDP